MIAGNGGRRSGDSREVCRQRNFGNWQLGCTRLKDRRTGSGEAAVAGKGSADAEMALDDERDGKFLVVANSMPRSRASDRRS